jgi:hypothetical protein
MMILYAAHLTAEGVDTSQTGLIGVSPETNDVCLGSKEAGHNLGHMSRAAFTVHLKHVG